MYKYKKKDFIDLFLNFSKWQEQFNWNIYESDAEFVVTIKEEIFI